MANLIAPRYIAPDLQKTWLAAEQERASRDRTSLARQSEASRSVEAQQRLAQSGAQTAMNLQTQMQNMAQKADMHPLQMIEAQKRNQNLSLSNQAAAQQLILNEDKHELDQLQGIASLSASRTQTQINKKTLEEKIRQDSEAPIFSEKINLINQMMADPNTNTANLQTLDSNGLSGRNLLEYNILFAKLAAQTSDKEAATAQGLARKTVAQQDAALIASGANPAHLADPALRAAALQVRNAAVIDGFMNNPSVVGKLVDVADYTDVNGWVDHAALQKAVQTADNMLAKMATSVPPTQAQISGWISTRIKSLTDSNPDENAPGHLSASQIRTQAGKDVDSMVEKGRRLAAAQRVTGQGDELSEPNPPDGDRPPIDTSNLSDDMILAMRNYAYATYRAALGDGDVDLDYKADLTIGSGKDKQIIKGLLGADVAFSLTSRPGIDFGFSPDSPDLQKEFLKKITDEGLEIQEVAGTPNKADEKPGVVYWVVAPHGEKLKMYTIASNGSKEWIMGGPNQRGYLGKKGGTGLSQQQRAAAWMKLKDD